MSNNYMNKVEEGHADEVIISDIEGNAVASGVKIGSSDFSGSDSHLATESGVKSYADKEMVSKENVTNSLNQSAPSDKLLVSEKAFLEALQIQVVD